MSKEYIPVVDEFGETRGYRFKQMREMEEMSLRWISRQTRIPRKTLELAEQDRTPFTADMLSKLIRIFKNTDWV